MLKNAKVLSLVIIVIVEFALVSFIRYPLNKTPINTPFEYQLGQVVISSENWSNEGLITRRSVPSRSINQTIPEWNGSDQDYFSMPPLAFLLHFGLKNSLPSIHPIIIAKILGHFALLATIIITSILLFPVFGFWATHIIITFFMTSKPVLVWMIDGYFPPTLSLMISFIITAWLANQIQMMLSKDKSLVHLRVRDYLIFILLGFVAGFSEYLSLFSLIFSVLLFTLAGLISKVFRNNFQMKHSLKTAFCLTGGGSLAVFIMATLYINLHGLSYFLNIYFTRAQLRTGSSGDLVSIFNNLELLRLFNTMKNQFLTGWAPEIMLLSIAATGFITIATLKAIWRQKSIMHEQSILVVLTLSVAFLPSLAYQIIFNVLVSVHYWFTSTWTVYLSYLFGIIVFWLQKSITKKPAYRLFMGILIALFSILLIGSNLNNISNYKARVLGNINNTSPFIYPEIASSIPRDTAPAIFIDLDKENISVNFPYATANLLRPILLYSESDGLMLASRNKIGIDKLSQWENVYLIYNPNRFNCFGENISELRTPNGTLIKICRVSTTENMENNIRKNVATD